MFLYNLLQSRRSRRNVFNDGDEEHACFSREHDNTTSSGRTSPYPRPLGTASPMQREGKLTDPNMPRHRQQRRIAPRQILRRASSFSTVSDSTNSSPSRKSSSRHSTHNRRHGHQDDSSSSSYALTSRGGVSFEGAAVWSAGSNIYDDDDDERPGHGLCSTGAEETLGTGQQPRLSSFIFSSIPSSSLQAAPIKRPPFHSMDLAASDSSSCDELAAIQQEPRRRGNGKNLLADCDKDDIEYLTTSHCQNNYGSRRKPHDAPGRTPMSPKSPSNELMSPDRKLKSPRPKPQSKDLASPGREQKPPRPKSVPPFSPLSGRNLSRPKSTPPFSPHSGRNSPRMKTKSPRPFSPLCGRNSPRSRSSEGSKASPGRMHKLLGLLSPSRKNKDDGSKVRASPLRVQKTPRSPSIHGSKVRASPLPEHTSPRSSSAVDQRRSKMAPRLSPPSPLPEGNGKKVLENTRSEDTSPKFIMQNYRKSPPAEIHVSPNQNEEFPDADDMMDPMRPLVLGQISKSSPLGEIGHRMNKCLADLRRGSATEPLLRLIAESPTVCQIMYPIPEQGNLLCFPFHYFCSLGWLEGCKSAYEAFPEAIGMECSQGLPLHYACAKPNLEVIQYLLQIYPGASCTTNRALSQTPMHRACQSAHCNLETIILLLNYFPYAARLADSQGQTPYDHAKAVRLHPAILRMLKPVMDKNEQPLKKREP